MGSTEQKEISAEESIDKMAADEANAEIDRQVEVMRDLNDILIRTDRLQLLMILAMPTAASAVGTENFLSDIQSVILGIPSFVFWLIGIGTLFAGLSVWLFTFFNRESIPLSEMNMGNTSTEKTYEECVRENTEKISYWENWVQNYQRKLDMGIIFLIATFVLFLL